MSTRARRARPSDWLAIQTLTQKARRALPRLWWWEEHLDDDLFIVVEQEGVVTGAFLAWPDESPVAWVRLAALDDESDADEWLAQTLPLALNGLRRRRTESLAWMDYPSWAGPSVRSQGFNRLTDVITFAKLDRTLPEPDTASAAIRPAADADVPAVVAVDRAAFPPHWWHSEETIRRRTAAPSHFAVAEAENTVIGYVEGEFRLPSVHLNRIAVHPDYQGRGVGASLLHDALCAFWQRGAEQITLNTQADNFISQQLYRRFGFEPVGEAMIVWELHV